MNFKELDVVRLQDGREGTILEIFDHGKMLYMEMPTDDDELYSWEWIQSDLVTEIIYHVE